MATLTSTPPLHILTRSDIADVPLTPREVIDLVEEAYIHYANKESYNPVKMMLDPQSGQDSVAYSMLGYDGNLHQMGFKTSYRQGNDNADHYYTTISLYDDTNGLPFALMDCQRVGASRTPATSALIARSCARPGAESVLMIGTGIQGRNTLPYLLTAIPTLRTIRLFGTHPDGIAASQQALATWFPERTIELVDDVPAAARNSDIVVVASGRAAHPLFETSWLPEGGLCISVASKGVAPGALRDADYVVVTNTGQVAVTGKRLAGVDGEFVVNAELPEILAGNKPGRVNDSDRIFAFSSGMIITDIPVAHTLAIRAIAADRGQKIDLWS